MQGAEPGTCTPARGGKGAVFRVCRLHRHSGVTDEIRIRERLVSKKKSNWVRTLGYMFSNYLHFFRYCVFQDILLIVIINS